MRQPSQSLIETLAFVNALRSCSSSAEVAALLTRAMAQHGVKNVLAGIIPMPGTRPKEQLRHILLQEWPGEWAARYFRNGYLHRDPTIEQVQRGGAPFLWNEMPLSPSRNRPALDVMSEARAFSLDEGCTVPLVTLDGRAVGFSFAGKHIDDAPEVRGMMQLVASFALARVMDLRQETRVATAKLTPREREITCWLSAGKTDWEISVILGVSEAAIAKHVRNVRVKLGAVNRSHAVAEALRAGLIS